MLTVIKVMVSTSGATLLPQTAIRNLSQRLLPLTTVLTPNIPEATLLLQQNNLTPPPIRSVDDMEQTARLLQSLGPKWVLVKGGHVPLTDALVAADKDEDRKAVVDVLVGPDGQVFRVQAKWQKSTSTHGTGCSLACKSKKKTSCMPQRQGVGTAWMGM